MKLLAGICLFMILFSGILGSVSYCMGKTEGGMAF
jgi:hypothetical protein